MVISYQAAIPVGCIIKRERFFRLPFFWRKRPDKALSLVIFNSGDLTPRAPVDLAHLPAPAAAKPSPSGMDSPGAKGNPLEQSVRRLFFLRMRYGKTNECDSELNQQCLSVLLLAHFG